MKPQSKNKSSTDLFREELAQMINLHHHLCKMHHPLCKMSEAIDWEKANGLVTGWFESSLADNFS